MSTQNAVGTHVDLAPSTDSAYSLPGTLTPNGNTSLQTTASYATSFAVASMMGPNSATSNTSYDTYGRPTQSQIPDGATTTYAYTYSPPTQTATVNGRWQKTTLDGFGRAIRVDHGKWDNHGFHGVYRVCAVRLLADAETVPDLAADRGRGHALMDYLYLRRVGQNVDRHAERQRDHGHDHLHLPGQHDDGARSGGKDQEIDGGRVRQPDPGGRKTRRD